MQAYTKELIEHSSTSTKRTISSFYQLTFLLCQNLSQLPSYPLNAFLAGLSPPQPTKSLMAFTESVLSRNVSSATDDGATCQANSLDRARWLASLMCRLWGSIGVLVKETAARANVLACKPDVMRNDISVCYVRFL